MKPILKRLFTLVLIATVITVQSEKARALSVFDGANYSQNLLTAVRTLQMINNQVEQLQNEARMLVNMAEHLERLDYSSLTQLDSALGQIDGLMREAQGIAFEVQASEEAFARYYPEEYQDTVTYDELAAEARQRWQYSMDAFRHSLRVQSHISQSIAADRQLLNSLVSESQSAVGTLQAQQATNQLIALSVQQAAQTQQLMVAQYRAEALDRAGEAAGQEQARAQFLRFIGDGDAYTPLN